MIFHFILNPKSGRNPKQKKLEKEIKAACTKRQLSYHIYYTTCAGDATEYVKSMVRISAEKQRFICVGGDGTINEIANSAPCNPNVEFGVIPSGSGNDFVKSLPKDEHFEKRIDLIKFNDSYCANILNIGFDCDVVATTEKLKRLKLVKGSIAYAIGVVCTIFKRLGKKFEIEMTLEDGKRIREIGDHLLCLVANGKYYGGGFKSAPLAELDDGLLDVVLVKKMSRFRFIRFVGGYKKGKHRQCESEIRVYSKIFQMHRSLI